MSDEVRAALEMELFAALGRAGEWEGARAVATKCLQASTPANRADRLDLLASAILFNEFRELLQEADEWSREALVLAPDLITRKGTRGSVLVEQRRFEEGELLLTEVWERSVSELDAAITAFYLGLVAKSTGRTREFRRWSAEAKTLAPFAGKWLSQRISREFAEPLPSSTG